MPNLEDLVPPLALCRKIPEGAFAESVFWRVWSAVEQRYILCQRGTGAFANTAAIPCPCGMRYTYPAPTLPEILAKMAECPQRFNSVTCEVDGTDFCVIAFVPYRGKPGSKLIEFRDTNAAAAALELWLYGLKGI